METNAVVANWFVLVPAAAVGAVGVPVNEGEAIVALKAISEIFVVILKVFEAIKFVLFVILVVFAAIAFVLVVMFALLAAMSFVLVVILEVFAAIEFVLDVMLAVFAAIDVGKVAIVDENTPPTLFTVGKSAVPPKSFVNLSLPLFVASASGV